MSDFVEAALEALQANETLALATVVGPQETVPTLLGRKLMVRQDGQSMGSFGLAGLDQRVEADCRLAMAGRPATQLIGYKLTDADAGQLGLGPPAEVSVFIELIEPSPALLIVGAGHIAQPLCRIGSLLGFDVTVLDDRPSFANRKRFPEAGRVIVGQVEEELARFPVTSSTYIVLVTRGHAQDEEALRQVVTSGAAYIGMIGSRRRSRAVLQRLADDGIPGQAIARVCSPIGLDINAQTPEEIAVSILAEVINERRGGGRHAAAMSSGKELRSGVG